MALFQVNTTNDTGDDQTFGANVAADAADGGGLSLREAIYWANSTTGADTISFTGTAFSSAATIALMAGDDGGQIEISDDVTITGSSAGVTIDAGGAFRIFEFTGGTSTVSGVTLANGDVDGDGGAVAVSTDTALTLENVSITGSTATGLGGALFVASDDTVADDVTLTNVSFSGNSGSNDETNAVDQDATLTVADDAAGDVLLNETGATNPAVASFGVEGEAPTAAAGSEVTGTYGRLTLNANGSYTYVADTDAAKELAADEEVADVFTYVVSDDDGTRTTATLTIDVTGLNDAPVAKPDTIEGDGTTFNVLTDETTGDSDVDGDALKVTLANFNGGGDFSVTDSVSPSIAGDYGTLTISADGSVSYVADETKVATLDETGATETFNYTVSDGTAAVETSITVNVAGENDAPVAADDEFTSTNGLGAANSIGTANVITDSDTDADADTITVTKAGVSGGTQVDVTAPTVINGTYGALTIDTDGTVTYDDFDAIVAALGAGEFEDVFSYTVKDDALTDTATITVKITGEDAAPVGEDDTETTTGATGDETVTGTIALSDEDDGETAVITRVTSNNVPTNAADIAAGSSVEIEGQYGTLTLASDGTWSYVDDQELNDDDTDGTETFTYVVSDGTGDDDVTHTITITVGATDNAPVAADDVATVATAKEGGNVLANDVDKDAADTLAVTGIKVDGAASFEPFSGTDATLVNGTNGVLSIKADGSYTYTPFVNAAPAEGETALDVFEYKITTDGTDDTALLTIEAGPKAVDDPIAAADAEEGDGANALTNDLEAIQADLAVTGIAFGEASAAVSSTEAGMVMGAYGELTIASDGSYTYVASGDAYDALPAGEVVTDTFTYTVAEGDDTTTADIVVTVTGVNDAPVAADLTVASGDAEVADEATVMGSVSDVDTGDTVTVTGIVLDPGETDVTVTEAGVEVEGTHGTLTIKTDGSYSYAVAEGAELAIGDGETGTDVFQYTVTDAGGDLDTGKLSITVEGMAAPMNETGDSGANTIKGGSASDALFGGGGNDKLKGRDGDDTLDGGSGDDKLNGGAGDDTLRGGSGDDRLKGKDGDDRLEGEAGDDKLTGGDGADRFVFGEGSDRITDFEMGDVLEISKGLFDGDMTAEEVMDEFAGSKTNGKGATVVELDFGEDTLKIKGDGLTMDMVESAIVFG